MSMPFPTLPWQSYILDPTRPRAVNWEIRNELPDDVSCGETWMRNLIETQHYRVGNKFPKRFRRSICHPSIRRGFPYILETMMLEERKQR
jgi:hypothetical protein